MANSHWSGVLLNSVRLEDVEFSHSTMRNAVIENSMPASGYESGLGFGFKKVKFQNSNFENFRIRDCFLKNVTFLNVNLRDTVLQGLRVEGETFRSAEEVLEYADIKG